MKNTLKKININHLTYFLFVVCLFSGLFKNIIIVFLIVLIHELGHVFFVLLYKYQVLKIELYPFGGITKIEKDLNSPITHDLLISMGGFVFQLILLLIMYILLNINFINVATYNMFKNYNAAILLFNLLPIIPLDGHIILKCILEKFFCFKKSRLISIIISIIGIFFYLQYNYVYSINNYMIIFFIIYKTYESYKNTKYVYNKFLLERFINVYPYKKVKEEKRLNLRILKRETLHFFKVGDKYVHERVILKKKFDKNTHF